jgi:hypothetical protein
MSYQPKFIRRWVKKRKHLAGTWILELECGHQVTTGNFHAGLTVSKPVCPTCNQTAADLGRAKRLVDDLPARTK